MADIRLGNLLWKNNTQPISVSNPVNTKDVNSDAIKNKVDTLATETKLEQVRTLLAGVATEDKLEQARALLQTISGKDFATQTTLAQVKSELELVKAELQAIKANQLSGDQKVQLSGTNMVQGKIFDAYAPTTTDLIWGHTTGVGGDGQIPLSTMKNLELFVWCSIDVPVEVIFSLQGEYERGWRVFSNYVADQLELEYLKIVLARSPSAYYRYHLIQLHPMVQKLTGHRFPGVDNLYVGIKPLEVPTSGSFTLFYRGDKIV